MGKPRLSSCARKYKLHITPGSLCCLLNQLESVVEHIPHSVDSNTLPLIPHSTFHIYSLAFRIIQITFRTLPRFVTFPLLSFTATLYYCLPASLLFHLHTEGSNLLFSSSVPPFPPSIPPIIFHISIIQNDGLYPCSHSPVPIPPIMEPY